MQKLNLAASRMPSNTTTGLRQDGRPCDVSHQPVDCIHARHWYTSRVVRTCELCSTPERLFRSRTVVSTRSTQAQAKNGIRLLLLSPSPL